jgi:hypothetical protein
MKKTGLFFIGTLGLIAILIAAAGVYKFNFTNDDIYIEQKDGTVVPYESLDDTENNLDQLESN